MIVGCGTRAVTEDESIIRSMREWLDSWGDGPNWSDPTGATIPITKTSLRQLLDAVDRVCADLRRMKSALHELRGRALDASRSIGPAFAASFAHIADEALTSPMLEPESDA